MSNKMRKAARKSEKQQIRQNVQREVIQQVVEKEKEHAQELLDYAIKGYTAVVAKVLHEQLGFGKQRIAKILDAVEEKFHLVQEGNLDLDQLIIDVNEWVQIEKIRQG